MARTRLTLFVVSTAISSAIAQNIIQISSPPVTLSATLGRPITSVATIGISGGSPGAGPAAVKFKYAGVTPVNPLRPTPPNFVVVFPSGGTTSTDNTAIDILNPPGVLIGLNEG